MVMCSIHLHTGTNIAAFMAHYREAFPDASVLPKMHMMESHIVPFLKQWGVGLGLMGEQGAESIHAAINGINRSYSNIPDKVKRLKCILDEHHRRVCPILVEQQPPIQKRNLVKQANKED